MRRITIGPPDENVSYAGPILLSKDIISIFGLRGALTLLTTSSPSAAFVITLRTGSDLILEVTPVKRARTGSYLDVTSEKSF